MLIHPLDVRGLRMRQEQSVLGEFPCAAALPELLNCTAPQRRGDSAALRRIGGPRAQPMPELSCHTGQRSPRCVAVTQSRKHLLRAPLAHHAIA